MADIRIATEDDADQVFDLFVRRSRAAFGFSELQREQFDAEFTRDDGTERWVADDVSGYAHLTGDGRLVCAAVDPKANDALLARAEQAARERGLAAIELTAVREDEPLWALAGRAGFRRSHDVLRMWRTVNAALPDPAWPDGVDVRTYTDTDAERVHDLLDASYESWDRAYVPVGHREWLAFMTDHDEFDPTMWFLVERDGELVACALHWKEHQRRGWVKDIVVRENERGRGLAKALLHHGLREYAKRAVERVGLKVDSSNPTGALQLYERVGFEVERRYAIWVKLL